MIVFRKLEILLPWAAQRPKAEAKPAASGRRSKQYWDGAAIVLFGAIIALPGGVALMGLAKPFDAELEGRVPSPAPTLAMKEVGPIVVPRLNSLRNLPSEFEPYFKDRVAFRRDGMQAFIWTRLHHLTTVSQELRMPAQEAPSNVLIGKEGWLYFTGDRSIAGYRRTDPYTFGQLESLRLRFEARRDSLRERGIEYVVAIAPNKGTIYPEYLPDFIHTAAGPSRLDQLLDHMGKHSSVRFVDLRPSLLEAKKQVRIYHKSDTHWNLAGAQVAFASVLRAIDHPDASAETWDRYVFNEIGHVTDERKMLGNLPPEERVIYLLTREKSQPPLGGAMPKCLLLHDSFFEILLPYFRAHFEEVRNFGQQELPMDVVDSWKPSIVVESFVERKLNRLE